MNVIGFDVATKKVYFALYTGNNSFACVDQLHNPQQLGFLKAKYGIDSAAIEEIPYVPKRSVRTTIRLSEAVGRVQQQLIDHDIHYIMLPVNKWKMLSIGDGKADKITVKNVIIATSNVKDGHPQDIYDAAGVAIAGYSLAGVSELEPSKFLLS